MTTKNCKEFNFIAKDNTQSQNKQYGGKSSNTYPGYESKIFSLTNTGGEGGITFIKNSMDNKARSVSNNNDNDSITISGQVSHLQTHGDASNEEVKFYPRVEDSGNTGQSSNDFALFNGSSILKDADIKHADIHLTHTLFQKTNNNHIVKHKDNDNLLDETTIEAEGNANKMTENNVYTFIDEKVKIDGKAAGTKCVIGPNIYLGKNTQIEEDNKLRNIYIGPNCKLNKSWHYQPENPSDTNHNKLDEFFNNEYMFVHVAFEDDEIVLKEVSDKNDLAKKIKELLGFDNSDDTKYIERNAGNKNIWIGKKIEISKSNCFDDKKIKRSKEKPLTNLLVLNNNSNKFDVNNSNYKFYHNCIIELNYYKEIFDQVTEDYFYKIIVDNYDKKRLFIFAKPEDLGNFKLGNNLLDTDTSKTSKASTSKTSKAPSSTGKKSSSKKISALDALIDDAIVTGSDKIGPEIKMSTGRMRASKGSTSSKRESDTRTKAFTSGEISDEIKDIASDIQGLIKDFKGSEGIFSGGGSNYVSKMQAVDDSLNSIKFLESKIQESKVGKDKDASSIGLFKFITSESRKALKDKQLTDSTRKLYEELEADKKDLEPYYSSKFLLKSGDVEKLLKYIDSLNDTNKWGGDKFIQETKQKIINSNKDQIDDFIKKLKAEYTKTEAIHGRNSNHFKNTCQLIIDLTGKSKYDNPYLFKELAKLRKDGDMFDSKICVSQRKDTDKKQGKGKTNPGGNTGQGQGKGQGQGQGQGKKQGGNKGKGKGKGKKKK